MTQKQIIDCNKRCAEFLGWEKAEQLKNGYCAFNEACDQVTIEELKFHSDWNWIMEIVESIEKELDGTRPFKYGKLDVLDFNIGNKSVKVKASFWTNPNTVNGNYWSHFKYNKRYNNISKKEAVVQVINQFLIWYNNEKSIGNITTSKS